MIKWNNLTNYQKQFLKMEFKLSNYFSFNKFLLSKGIEK